MTRDLLQYSQFNQHPTLMPYAPCSDLKTRRIKWISRTDQLKNGDGRSSQFIHWGVPAATIAAQYAETHAADVAPCPISGWRGWQR